jgi:hypothetical protein
MLKTKRLYDAGYDSQEDVENQRVIVPSSNSVDYSTMEVKTRQRQIEVLPDKEKSLERYRFMNSISILVLLATFYSVTLIKINSQSYFILEQFKEENLYSEFNLYVLYMAFFFVTCIIFFKLVSLILALLRNTILKKDVYHRDIETVLLMQFGSNYSTANLLFACSLITNHFKVFDKLGLNVVISLTTFVYYFKAYYAHKRKLINVKFTNVFNFISLSVNISFLLAWNVAYLTISIAAFLNYIRSDVSFLCTTSVILQACLSCLCILAISNFGDLFFCFIILIFQVGNILNSKIFTYKDHEIIQAYNSINFLITGFTILCFIWTSIFPKTIKSEEEIDELNYDYKQSERNSCL